MKPQVVFDSADIVTRYRLELGTLVGLTSSGQPIVDLPSRNGSATAASAVVGGADGLLPEFSPGSKVLLAVDINDNSPPLMLAELDDQSAAQPGNADDGLPFEVLQAGAERLHIEAKKEITISCGKSSITLTKEGKVLIKAVEITSRASGRNKVKGASISIN